MTDTERGFITGHLHCCYGFCVDSACDDNICTPYLTGYKAGWDEAKKNNLHGTKQIPRDNTLQPFEKSYIY